jgi:hypothetical protein
VQYSFEILGISVAKGQKDRIIRIATEHHLETTLFAESPRSLLAFRGSPDENVSHFYVASSFEQYFAQLANFLPGMSQDR